MAIGHELAFAREAFQGLALEDAVVAVEIVENAPVEDEEAGADPAVDLRLFGELCALRPVRRFRGCRSGRWGGRW